MIKIYDSWFDGSWIQDDSTLSALIFLQFELVAELFADMGAGEAEKGGRVQALKSGPKGGSKQMKRTVGSQVIHGTY